MPLPIHLGVLGGHPSVHRWPCDPRMHGHWLPVLASVHVRSVWLKESAKCPLPGSHARLPRLAHPWALVITGFVPVVGSFTFLLQGRVGGKCGQHPG